jgi:AcrR family transcriptional regulator
MGAVAARLGVAKPTLYRMAGSRDELIRTSIEAETERLLDAVHRDGAAGVLRFASESPAGFKLLFGDRYPQARPAVRRVENRLYGAGGKRALAAAGLLGMAVGIARRALEDGADRDLERLRSDFDALAKFAERTFDLEAVGRSR